MERKFSFKRHLELKRAKEQKMTLSREQRELMNGLSKEVFGAASRWQKLLAKGDVITVTEEKEETIPESTQADGTVIPASTRKIQVPVLDKHGRKQFVTKYYTVEEVLQLMIGFKQQMEQIRATITRQAAERKAKEEKEKHTKAIESAAGGSAV